MFKPNIELMAKAEEILKDRDTKEWLDTIDSDSAQINYQKHVAEYLLFRKQTIQQLISNFKKKKLNETKKVQEFVNFMLKKLAPSTVANYVSAIKSRLQYDSLSFARDIRVKNRTYHQTITEEITPTKDQVIQFLRNAKPDTQLIIALMAFMGIRFHTIAGLKIADFPEMRITENNEIIFEKIPTRVKIRRELSKNKRNYETFFIEFGCKILENSLKIRMNKGEKINSNSLIVPIDSDESPLRLKAKAISRRLYTVFNKINFDSRPYSLKGYFATQLMNSGIQQNYQTLFMGHSGIVQNEYVSQRKFSTEQIEKMRTLFKEQIQPHLVPQESDANRVVNHHFKEFAKQLGLEVKDTSSTDETIAEIAEVYKAGQEDLLNRENNVQRKQKRIKEAEIDKYLNEDWELHTTLPSGDLVIKKVFYN